MLNNRVLALIALSVLFTGCARIPVLMTDSADTGQQEVSDTASTALPAEFSKDSEIVVTITNEPGSDLATLLMEEKSAIVAASAKSEDERFALQVMAETDAQIHAQINAEIDAQISAQAETQSQTDQDAINDLCWEIGNKLGSVSVEDCLAQPLKFADGYTVQSRPMVVRDFDFDSDEDNQGPRILFVGGIHGDEYSSISIIFRWMELLEQSGNEDFRWRFAPSVNPDGLLGGQAVRQNANGVDLNRNFPSDDWLDLAVDFWANSTNSNPRRFPGTYPASEPEVKWIVEEIESFAPDVIVSVHAPYHLLDYDGPPEPPQNIGELHLHLLGVYPGSLGNYAGINLGIPVVTMELPSAGIMPSNEEIVSMWNDLLDWLYEHHES